jgi:hypothetical protein
MPLKGDHAGFQSDWLFFQGEGGRLSSEFMLAIYTSALKELVVYL